MREIEKTLKVKITGNREKIFIRGPDDKIIQAAALVQQLISKIQENMTLIFVSDRLEIDALFKM
jgi:hypothetical protein